MPDLAPAPVYAFECDVCCEDIADAEVEEAVIRSDTRICHHPHNAITLLPFLLFKQPILPALIFVHDCADKLWLISGNLRL